MSQTFKRRIRIEGKPGSTAPVHIIVRDADTGEIIDGIRSITVFLNASEVNQAKVEYYGPDEQGKILVQDGRTVESRVVVSNPEIDVTAYEQLDA